MDPKMLEARCTLDDFEHTSVVKRLTDPFMILYAFPAAGFKYSFSVSEGVRGCNGATTLPGLEMLVFLIRMTRTRATVPVPGEKGPGGCRVLERIGTYNVTL